MATETETISGYWKRKLREHPKLLRKRSNDELHALYLRDHAGETEVPGNFKQGLSNVKSSMRTKKGKPGKVGRPPKAKAVDNGKATPAPRPMKASRGLEALEDHIDECLALAKHHDREGLESVIHLLRKARNEVVILAGA